MTCAICYEEMDMQEFRDVRESTETCFKIECGHAFHTKCIIMVLSKTEHQCPSCNKYKTHEQLLEWDGLVKKLVKDVKKDDRTKVSLNEYREAKAEYRSVLKKLTDESRVWIRNRAQELKIPEHKSYYYSSASSVIKTAKEVAADIGNKHAGVFIGINPSRGIYGDHVLPCKILFGADLFGHRDWRLRRPRVWVPL